MMLLAGTPEQHDRRILQHPEAEIVPMPRSGHTATIVEINEEEYLAIYGGKTVMQAGTRERNDLWLLNCKTFTWKQIKSLNPLIPPPAMDEDEPPPPLTRTEAGGNQSGKGSVQTEIGSREGEHEQQHNNNECVILS